MQARCDVLQSAAAAGAAGGEQPASAGADDQDVSFKWDRECEEALHTVVLNRIAVGTGCELTRIAHARFNCCVCADRSRNRSQQAQVCFQGCAGTGDLAGRLGRREGAQARPHARDEAARARGRRQRRRQAAGGGGALTRHLAHSSGFLANAWRWPFAASSLERTARDCAESRSICARGRPPPPTSRQSSETHTAPPPSWRLLRFRAFPLRRAAMRACRRARRRRWRPCAASVRRRMAHPRARRA